VTPENKRSDVRLSAEERAEKIASSFLVGDQLAEARQGLAGLIAAQIAEAVREAVEEANDLNRREIEVAHKIVEGVKALNDHQLDIAREAYKKAERAASDHFGHLDGEDEECPACGSWRIRALRDAVAGRPIEKKEE
jgi:nickel-dependent lactate racemase